MSDTPRSDAMRVLCNYGVERVTVDFARELERETAKLGAEATRLKDWQNRGEYAERMNTELKAECAALREDKVRLDVIQSSGWHLVWSDRAGGFYVQARDQVCGNIGVGWTVREAIDVARGLRPGKQAAGNRTLTP